MVLKKNELNTIIILLCLAALLRIWLPSTIIGTASGSEVVIKIAGEEVRTLPLAENGVFAFDGPLGRMEIEIKERQVRMLSSDCPDRFCLRQGWIQDSHTPIICLPNLTVIEIVSASGLDGVSR